MDNDFWKKIAKVFAEGEASVVICVSSEFDKTWVRRSLLLLASDLGLPMVLMSSQLGAIGSSSFFIVSSRNALRGLPMSTHFFLLKNSGLRSGLRLDRELWAAGCSLISLGGDAFEFEDVYPYVSGPSVMCNQCKYFNGSPYLPCAVNPTQKKNLECLDFTQAKN